MLSPPACWDTGCSRSDRVGIYLDKRIETVVACFGAAEAGCVFVPLNPLLKPEQVGYILRDCNVRLLVTSPERLASIVAILPECPELRHVVVTGRKVTLAPPPGVEFIDWGALLDAPAAPATASSTSTWRRSSTRPAARASPRAWCCRIGTWSPARRASRPILGNHADDTLLAALPLSFDAGFSQLTTAFHVGAARRPHQLPASAAT
mgnify:CR=1 FL=1